MSAQDADAFAHEPISDHEPFLSEAHKVLSIHLGLRFSLRNSITLTDLALSILSMCNSNSNLALAYIILMGDDVRSLMHQAVET